MNPVDLAEELVNIPSVTGNEAALAEHLEQVCGRLGWRCEREYVGENRWNLYVNWRDRPRVVFCAHLDTVPPFIPARRDGEFLYGRGSCDTKGSMAAMIAAGVACAEKHDTPVFLFTAGEETDSAGAKTAARSGRRADYIVVGEPSENKLVAGHNGALSYTVSVEGRAAHSAYPDRGSSANHILLDILSDIRGRDWGTNNLLGPSTLNVGMISGGTAPNILAPSARATVVHRLVDSAEKAKNAVLEAIDGRGEIEFHSMNDPQLLHVPDGFESDVVSYGTDVPYLRSMAVPLLAGPGSIHDAHTDGERVSIGQLREAADLYLRLFNTLSK
jgi:acetylornithine deacetylase